QQVLAAVREHARGRVFLVFGCGGEKRPEVRPTMGKIAAAGADRIVLTDDNPRSEDPDKIIAEIRSRMPNTTSVEVIHDRAGASEAALAEAKSGDVVLVTGKGHETTQIIGHEQHRYNDPETVRRLLERAPW